jgi:hypothetical protein
LKDVNLQTIISPLIQWIADFKGDNGRLPQSLDDLINNKSPKRDYNPGRVVRKNRELGFSIDYSPSGDTVFELEVRKDNEKILYKSGSNILYFYKNDIPEFEQPLK